MALTGHGRLGAPTSNLYWFAELYEIITMDELAAARTPGTFEHPEFVLHFIPIFYDLYYNSLKAFEAGDLGHVSPQWQVAFKTATQSRVEPGVADVAAIMSSVETGVAAHIQGDMTTALVRAFQSFVQKYCLAGASLDDYRKDFFETNIKVFEQVKQDFIDQMAVVGPFPGDIDLTRELLRTGERLTAMGLDIKTVFAWRKTAWEGALRQLAANPVH